MINRCEASKVLLALLADKNEPFSKEAREKIKYVAHELQAGEGIHQKEFEDSLVGRGCRLCTVHAHEEAPPANEGVPWSVDPSPTIGRAKEEPSEPVAQPGAYDAIRTIYPNHGKPYSQTDFDIIIQCSVTNRDVEWLSNILGRTENALIKTMVGLGILKWAKAPTGNRIFQSHLFDDIYWAGHIYHGTIKRYSKNIDLIPSFIGYGFVDDKEKRALISPLGAQMFKPTKRKE